MKIKTAEIAKTRANIARQQAYSCGICGVDLMKISPRNWVLDHCHASGYVRGVLCRNCNGAEGKVKAYATRAKKKGTYIGWLENMLRYVKNKPPFQILHPSHKTDDEKRLKRNAAARKRRAAKKETPDD